MVPDNFSRVSEDSQATAKDFVEGFVYKGVPKDFLGSQAIFVLFGKASDKASYWAVLKTRIEVRASNFSRQVENGQWRVTKWSTTTCGGLRALASSAAYLNITAYALVSQCHVSCTLTARKLCQSV